MQIILKLELDDIQTQPCGNNIAIAPDERLLIVFSPEAALEFMRDAGHLLAEQVPIEVEPA